MSLAPIFCHGCGGPLPLAIPQLHVSCPYCSTVNDLPPAYVVVAEMRKKESAARVAAEPLWRKIGETPPVWAEALGVLAVIFLPPLLTFIGTLLGRSTFDVATLTALFTVPAIVPGTGLWLWAAAVRATTSGLRAQLAAIPIGKKEGGSDEGGQEKETLGCRSCGAALHVDEGALSATCGYCGTDSLLQAIPQKRVKEKMRRALRGLDEAVTLLRRRRVMLGLGAVGLSVVISGASGLLWYAVISIG